MKCILLAGGHGTRLRPLTLSIPKPFIPFCNMPVVEHQIEACVKAGVDHIILAISSEQNNMVPMIKELSEQCKVRIDCSVETESLGTAGPLRLAKKLICDPDDNADEFLVVNGDIICDYPFAEMIASHRKNEADGTILVTTTTHPSDFGVIVHDEDYRIKAFVEKPVSFISNQINAGVYVIKKSMIDEIPEGNVSIERYFFPMLVGRGKTFCHPLYGFWADLGKPSDYIRGQQLYMRGSSSEEREFTVYQDTKTPDGNYESSTIIMKSKGGLLARDAKDVTKEEMGKAEIVELKECSNIADDVVLIPPVLIDTSAMIESRCVIGPNVCVGPNTVIGNGCRIIRSTIMEKAKLEGHNYVEGSIIGWESQLKPWVRVEGLTVLGKDVTIQDTLIIRGSIVLPHKSVSKSIYEAGSIII